MRKVILFCAATLFSLLSFAQESDADIVKVGDNIPAFTLHSTANGTINSADLKGKVVLINIFATWCGPCQSELAEVQKILWPKYKNNKDFCMLVIDKEGKVISATTGYENGAINTLMKQIDKALK